MPVAVGCTAGAFSCSCLCRKPLGRGVRLGEARALLGWPPGHPPGKAPPRERRPSAARGAGGTQARLSGLLRGGGDGAGTGRGRRRSRRGGAVVSGDFEDALQRPALTTAPEVPPGLVLPSEARRWVHRPRAERGARPESPSSQVHPETPREADGARPGRRPPRLRGLSPRLPGVLGLTLPPRPVGGSFTLFVTSALGGQ